VVAKRPASKRRVLTQTAVAFALAYGLLQAAAAYDPDAPAADQAALFVRAVAKALLPLVGP
jgi:hypothetical protein